MRRGLFSRKIWCARSFPWVRISRFVQDDLEGLPAALLQADGAPVGLQEPGGGLRHVPENLPDMEGGGDRPADLVERDELGHPLPGVVIELAVPDRPRHLRGHGGKEPDVLLGIRPRGAVGEVHRPVDVDVVHDGDGEDRPELPDLPRHRQGGGRGLHVGVEDRGPFLDRLAGHPFPRPDPEIEQGALFDRHAGRHPRDDVLPPRFAPVDADAFRPGIPREDVADVLEAVLDLDVRIGDLDHPGEEGEFRVGEVVHGAGQGSAPFFRSAFS